MCGCAAGDLLEAAPIEIEYKWWESKRQRYRIQVTEVQNYRGKHGMMTAVTVRGSRTSETKSVVWPAKVFLRTFKPLGRKLKSLTRWERL